MNQKTLIALASCAVLGLIAFLVLRMPDKGERAADRPRPFKPVAAADIETLEVTKAGATSVLKSEGGKYKVTAPVAYAADEPIVKAAFEGIGKLEVSSLVTEQKTKHEEFQVDDKSGIHVVAKGKGGAALLDVIIGKAAGAGTMLRVTGKDEIWQASGISRYTFEKNPADWRDKSITTFPIADAEGIEVTDKGGGKIVLKKSGAKQGSDDKWDVAESAVKIDKPDNTVPVGIVSALATWKANDFADGVKLADAGLEPPQLTVAVVLKGGKRATALIGNKKGEDEFYVKTPETPQVFLVKKYNAERVMKAPIEFRDKTICDIPDTEVTEIAVNHGDNSFTVVKSGTEWKATKPAKLDVDPTKVTPMAGAFKEWKGQSFAEDQSPKTNGLAKPKATIAVKGKGSAGCVVKVGDETKDKLNYHVLAGKGSDVYLAPKWNVDRVLMKLDDLKKGAAPAVAANPHAGVPHGKK
jgi:hypothetical protein